jgi:glyoxylase-like metal-dependent hydrolase (beta-lactamase superfamily II)
MLNLQPAACKLVGHGIVKGESMTSSARVLGAVLALLAMPVLADETLSLEALGDALGWDFDNTQVTAETLADGFHVLFGVGGNIAASIGEDGTLLVDDQFPRMMGRIDDALAALGSKGIDFAVNTHWHFDHAEGNLSLGPRGTWLVSQANSRAMMADSHVINLVNLKYRQDPYPENARPVITYDDRMQFHFNGEQIDLMHFGPAHTTGDTAVIFRGRNAVHLGDVFNNSGYPFIDADNGGTIEGVIRFCSAALAEIDQQTRVIPGHGPVTDYQALRDYTDMLSVVRDRIAAMIGAGKTLEEVVAASPTAEFDERYGDPTRLVNRAYRSLRP